MAIGNEITALQEAEKLIKKLRDQAQGLNTDLLAISKSARESQGNFANIRLPKELEGSLQANQQLISQLNANAKERERLEKDLEKAIAKRTEAERGVNKEILKHRTETNLINAALRDEAVLSSKLAGAYQKLAVRHKQAARTLRDYHAEGKRANETQKQFNRRLEKAQNKFDVLDKKVRKADTATRDFRRNVGNYESAFGKATLALKSFGTVFGIYSGLQIAREIFEQVKALNALDAALKQVTETTDNYNRANQFISETADVAGADVLVLTSRYTKFLAAAKTTNLTLDQTENIFRQVAKAGGVLGLSTDNINGAFRALEQILSKGKVQAEEIRGQLGERLPGAFQILAKSMGLTTQELDKQLELGNVLSDEVLPKFADELEKTYSLDKVERVETLAAEQTRLKNAWVDFLNSVEGGENVLSRVFGDMLKAVTAVVDALANITKGVDGINQDIRTEKAQRELEDLEAVAQQTGMSLREVAALNFFDYTKSVERAREEVERLKKEQEGLSPTINAGRGVILPNKAYQENNRLLKEANTELAIREGRLDAVNGILRNTEKQIDRTTKALEEGRKKLKEISTISFGTTVDELRKLAKEAEKIAKSLSGTELGDGTTVQIGIDALDVPDTDEIIEALQKIIDKYKEIPEEAKTSAQKQQEIFDQLFSTFSSYYGLDLTAFSKLIGQKEATLEDYANFAKSVSQAILESRLIRYENEIVANQERLETILSDENLSEEQRQQAELEAQRKEKEIRTRQAKAERQNVLIQIGVDTAAAIVKALASSPPPANFVLAAAVGALGVAQAAFVASQPLPKFKEGVRDYKGGPAVLNDEQGSKFKELVETPDGKLFMSNKRNVVADLPKGTNVYSASETETILKSHQESEQEKIDLAIMRMTYNSMGELETKIENGIEKGFKKAKIVNNNRIVNQVRTRKYF